jgi:hypothetical protein
MARSPMFKVGVAGAVLALATLALLLYAASSTYRSRCEVCITFHGRTECREAYGKTREEATRTAADNACGLLAAGMTESVACTNTRPARVACSD